MDSPVKVKGALRRLHLGPGDHPSGSPQSVHAGDRGSKIEAYRKKIKFRPKTTSDQKMEFIQTISDLDLNTIYLDGINVSFEAPPLYEDRGSYFLGPDGDKIRGIYFYNTKMMFIHTSEIGDPLTVLHEIAHHADTWILGWGGMKWLENFYEDKIANGSSYQLSQYGLTKYSRENISEFIAEMFVSFHLGNEVVNNRLINKLKEYHADPLFGLAISADIIERNIDNQVYLEHGYVIRSRKINDNAILFEYVPADEFTPNFMKVGWDKSMGNQNQSEAIGVLRRLNLAQRHGKHVGQEGRKGAKGGSEPGFTHDKGWKDKALAYANRLRHPGKKAYALALIDVFDANARGEYPSAPDVERWQETKFSKGGAFGQVHSRRVPPYSAFEKIWRDLSEMAPLSDSAVQRGGPGSGYFGHAGRPGKVGGSAPKGSVAQETPVNNFSNEVTAAYSGQINGSLIAYDENSDYLGHIDWREFEGNVDIAWITVKEDMRRKGIATSLVRQLAKEFEGQKIFPTMTSREGAAFLDSIKNEGIIVFRHGVQKAVDRVMTALERLFE